MYNDDEIADLLIARTVQPWISRNDFLKAMKWVSEITFVACNSIGNCFAECLHYIVRQQIRSFM